MAEHTGKKMSREERLAEKLRENLRRRKQQSRALNDAMQDAPATESPASALSKPAGDS